MTVDVYRPLTVMLDAIEFAAKQALAKRKLAPVPWATRRPSGLESLSRVDSLIRCAAPHLRGEMRRSAASPTVELSARCQCGAMFSLLPLSERDLIVAFDPSQMIAAWVLDGLLAHRCEVYP